MSAIVSDYYRQAVSLFESGALTESLERFEAFLKERPISGKAWNGAGTVLFSLGQYDKAARYFLRSLEQQDRPSQAWRNLVCTYVKLGQPGKAIRWLKAVDHEEHADISLVCRTAQAFEQQSDLASAMGLLQWGRRLKGDLPRLDKQIDQLRDRRAKITFFTGGEDTPHLDAVVGYAQQRYPVRVYAGRDAADIGALMQQSDICWFEGCGDVTQTATNGVKACRTIVRLRQSDSDQRLQAVRWDHVDVLIAAGQPALRGLEQRWAEFSPKIPVVTIAEGIDVDRVSFSRRKPGWTIAVAAAGAGRAELLQCASELQNRCPKYRFYDMTDGAGLAQREDISFIVATGDTEPTRQAVYTAMACGIKPVVRDFPGAGEYFGKKYLFATPEEFRASISGEDYNSEEYRYFVEQKCPLSRSLLQIDELFAACEGPAAGGPAEAIPTAQTEEVSAAV
jgi:tetratricopeptide (TPR) repeat protein